MWKSLNRANNPKKHNIPKRIKNPIVSSLQVICCEGNAGFYEVGCMSTPLDGDYSVLGWNHPGFAGSTGVPFPQNEANAMDVVIQFAVHKLGFQLSDIIVYAWSIGGFETQNLFQHGSAPVHKVSSLKIWLTCFGEKGLEWPAIEP
ncbi:protein ABHD16A isoform X1 [Silurus asotus]|uniref:Protein ABHD16A isoform X1 n=1 Tax=Silurus asotus TaxID=30991 RepID=A0AAD5APY2_SILAS|nr:protein ABHD16A isoform X1 [Silurus asotus]